MTTLWEVLLGQRVLNQGRHFSFLVQVIDRGQKGPDKGHKDDKYSLFLLSPVGTSKGLKDVDTG